MQESELETTRESAAPTPLIVPRPEHSISRANISENALKVLYRLKQENFQAHLVGGGVRDLLLGHEPKDFDVATDATPEQVRQVFRNCRLIGRRFRLAHVHFGREIIEVATFRGNGGEECDDDDRCLENGMLVRDNVYGSIAEDALRRDFTINALYYDIRDFSLIDYAGGLADLRAGVLRLIGNPEKRYREDPVRMLRAVRFACKLGFSIEPNTEEPLFRLGDLFESIAPARLFDELIKLFHAGYGRDVFEKLRHYGLFEYLFPDTESCLRSETEGFPITFVSQGLANTDKRVQEGKSVTPAFLFAVLLWEPVRCRYLELLEDSDSPIEAMMHASSQVCAHEQERVAIPKRFSLPMREIWLLQPRFEQRSGKRPYRLFSHPRFRAAYDFLMLRAQAGEIDSELATWWTKFQQGSAQDRADMLGGGNKRRRPRKRRRKSSNASAHETSFPETSA